MREGQKATLTWVKTLNPTKKIEKTIWMHCSSLGEFEQGRMVLEGLKKRFPQSNIYLSFFSPSGYEIRKNWEVANYVFYLPSDTISNAQIMIEAIKPNIFILVKYDFWWILLKNLEQKKVPVYLVAAQFTSKRYYFKPPFVQIMKNWKGIFTIRENSLEILKTIGFMNASMAGDPRVDRVLSIKNNGVDLPSDIKNLCITPKKIYVYGSVWKEDMPVIARFINNNFDFIHVIVPHDTGKSNIDVLCNYLTSDYSLYSEGNLTKNVIIIDKVGFLSGLYKYAFIAYIGGGFGKGIHNILEPAVHEIPVCFGPAYTSFSEAVELVNEQCCFPVTNADKFEQTLQYLELHQEEYQKIKFRLNSYFYKHSGASEKIITHIIEENITA